MKDKNMISESRIYTKPKRISHNSEKILAQKFQKQFDLITETLETEISSKLPFITVVAVIEKLGFISQKNI